MLDTRDQNGDLGAGQPRSLTETKLDSGGVTNSRALKGRSSLRKVVDASVQQKLETPSE